MKIRIIHTTIIALLSSYVGLLSAQNATYIFYDPACIQQYDYQLIGKTTEQAHTDYALPAGKDRKIILTVLKKAPEVPVKFVSEIPVRPVMCNEYYQLDEQWMKSINAAKSTAYVVVEAGSQYALYPVHIAASFTTKGTYGSFKYNHPIYGFSYTPATAKNNAVLNAANSNAKERQIFYEGVNTRSCLSEYDFKVVSQHSETPTKHLKLLDNVGVTTIESSTGRIQLMTINGRSMTEYIANYCKYSQENPVTKETTIAETKTNQPKVIQDTVGMTALEKALWSSRFTARGGTPRAVPKAEKGDQYAPAPVPNPNPNNRGVQNGAQNAAANDLLPGGIYLVKQHEGLYTISNKFGISIHRLIEINQLKSNELFTNQRLKVVDDGSVPHQELNPIVRVDPTTQTKTTIHKVQQGQTLYTIAKLYGLELKDMYALNQQLTSEAIDINQELVVGRQKL